MEHYQNVESNARASASFSGARVAINVGGFACVGNDSRLARNLPESTGKKDGFDLIQFVHTTISRGSAPGVVSPGADHQRTAIYFLATSPKLPSSISFISLAAARQSGPPGAKYSAWSCLRYSSGLSPV